MKNNISAVQKQIRGGTHGEDYGSWIAFFDSVKKSQEGMEDEI